MLRVANPFDRRVGLAAQRLASGGANCSTCTTCSSCIVTAVGVTMLSSRLVARALPRDEALPAVDPTRAVGDGDVARSRWPSILIGAALPALVLATAVVGIASAGGGPWSLLAIALLALGGIGVNHVAADKPGLRTKLLLLNLLALPLLMGVEMIIWISLF